VRVYSVCLVCVGIGLEAQTSRTAEPTGIIIIIIIFIIGRARCSVVVKALCYKPEGPGFETR
jgi:hypothetical protein